jgi:hypothetical protein
VLPGCDSKNGAVGNSKEALQSIRSFIKGNNTSVVGKNDVIKLIIRTNIAN